MRSQSVVKRWRLLFSAILVSAFSLFAFCSNLSAQDNPVNTLPPTQTVDSGYKLGPLDKVRINIFNQEELSGEYQLDGNGQFSMPLIGTVNADGLTATELEALLVSLYKPDYLVNPRIFIQVGNYRPYYLMGEVATKGAFPYQPGLTYLEAIANAGGFTYRAKDEHVYVIRGNDPEQKEIKLSIDEEVQPGDIIRVAERLF